ncbi:MAG: rod shape-determining protein MreC [Endomicrobia bacterium]|nr:rod shape-determining protein MreC [Endomicrobiia bacterium]
MTIKEFVEKHRPTIFYVFFLLFGSICLTTQLITQHLQTFRSFLIYFFSYTYIPIYQIIDYPLRVVNKFVSIPYIIDENIKLREIVKKLYTEKIRYHNTMNKIETSIGEIDGTLVYKLITAEVIVREYKDWYNECISIVCTDTKDVLKEDLPVIYYTGKDQFFLAGRVWEVKNNVVKVLLITNPLSVIPVKVKNKQIYGVVIGNASPNLVMDYILIEDDIKIGDVIVTSGINNMPEGIEIGYVTNIELSTTGFKKATVKLNFNINALKTLFILVY